MRSSGEIEGDSPLLDPRHPLSRRGFLVRSAGAGAILASGGLLACGDDGYTSLLREDDLPRVLAPREFAILRALSQRILPADGQSPGADELGVPTRIDRELSFHGDRLQSDIRDALLLVEWSPLLTRLARFTSLSDAGRDAELRAMTTSRLGWRRSAFQGLKFLVMFFHYTQDASWPAIGYDGPWVQRNPPAALA